MILYLAFIIPIFAIVVGVLLYTNSMRRKALLRKLEESWGKPKKEEFPFSQICKFAVLTKNDATFQLSDQTLNDSNFYDVFAFVDRTTSKVGQQYFFSKLIRPASSIESLQRFDQHVEFLRTNPQQRLSIQQELTRLSNHDAYHIASLLRKHLLDRPTWIYLAKLNVVFFIVISLLCFKYPPLMVVALLSLIINFLIHYWNKSNTFLFTQSFPQLNILISVSERLSTAYPAFAQEWATQSINSLRLFQSKTSLLSFLPEGNIKDDLSQLGSYLAELLKAMLLIEFFMLFELIREVESKKKDIQNLITFAGEIDAVASVASLRSGQIPVCRPQLFPEGKMLTARDVYHPLIPECVKNDLVINGRSALITGSNMSGKTTFLRTLLLNSLFAQTIYTCFASEFKSAIFQHFSSIQIEDDLPGGKSFYLQEVRTVGALVREVGPAQQNLFVLDEVFKGTNSLERISAAKAILSYLNRYSNIVLVSTHDLELANMLSEEFDQYHFTDLVEENRLRFDHKIKAGPLKTRNAIRILEMSDYPEDIVREAKSVSNSLVAIRGEYPVK